MYFIPEAIKNLLKSRSMLGPEAPACKVRFGGKVENEEHPLFDAPVQLEHWPVDIGSEVVTDEAGTTTYTRDVDYAIDYAAGTITRIPTGSIPYGTSVLVDYTYWQELQPSRVIVSREKAARAQACTITFPNVNPADPKDVGYYSPDRGIDNPALKNKWFGVIMPGRSLEVYLGYGQDLVCVFAGNVDDVWEEVRPSPRGVEYTITVEARDRAWNLTDRIVSGPGGYELTYTNQTVEAIVSDLLQKAGWQPSEITTEATGITLPTARFDRISYADAIEWCMNVSGFELVIDEYGRAHWIWPTDRQPAATDEAVVLTGTDWVPLAHKPIVSGSERVTDQSGATVYVRDIDYYMDYKNGAIRRTGVGSIPDGATVLVDYVYAAWVFREGEDILRLSYHISRRNVYASIIVQGTNVSGTYTFWEAGNYGCPPDKVLITEIPEIDTAEKAQQAANQMGNEMVRRVREVTFAAVGIPWVQVGDCVQVIESSTTISEIYRLLSLEFEFDERGFIMTGVAYHYGYAPL